MAKKASARRGGPPGAQKRPNASLTPARRLAQDILLRVTEQGAHASFLLHAGIGRAQLSAADAAWLTELVYGTLRHHSALVLALRPYLPQFARLPPYVQGALTLGAYQILHMRVPAYTAVDAAVALVRPRSQPLAGLVNAVLRKLAASAAAQDPAAAGGQAPLAGPDAVQDLAALAARSNHPAWWLAAWREQYPPNELQALLQANNQRPKLSLRVNPLRSQRETLLAELARQGHKAVPSPVLPEGILLDRAGDVRKLAGFYDGHFVVQDMAAALVAHALAPPPGATVLDLCAAPGGKSTHLAECMGGMGQVFAVDHHPGRLGLIAKNATRLGHGNVTPVAASVLEGPALRAALAQAGAKGPFSFILLDPPCSGSGTVRRHPELRTRGDEGLPQLLAGQAAMLRVAASLLAVGGRLVYSVCSLLADEGERQVTAFLRQDPKFSLLPLPALLHPYARGSFLHTLPHAHDLDGFFAAVLTRVA